MVGRVHLLFLGERVLHGASLPLILFHCHIITTLLRQQLRSLRSLVLPDPSIAIAASSGATTATVNPAQRRRRITFLFIEACMQILYMGALVRLG